MSGKKRERLLGWLRRERRRHLVRLDELEREAIVAERFGWFICALGLVGLVLVALR